MIVGTDNLAHRHPLIDRMANARRRSDALFQLVRPESRYDRPIPQRHRILFYLGHIEAFDWNLLRDRVLGVKSFHPEFDRLFAFGIDPVGGGLPSDQPSDWPAQEAVRDYASRIRTILDAQLVRAIPESHTRTQGGASLGTSLDASPETLLNVAIEHRLMHVETLAYMLHQLPYDKKVPQGNRPVPLMPPVAHRMVEIPAGVATVGLSRSTGSFGWDNEHEAHRALVARFEMDQFMVTNRQYLDFISAGGYETGAYWSEDGWNWKTAHGISHPVFWRNAGNRWLYRCMFAEVPLPLDWPVYVSHAEAAAYAHWAGKALPTEEEWHRAAYGSPDGSGRTYPWGNGAPDSNFGNFDFERWDPIPVNALPSGRSAFGVHGMLGNGWEWTSTVFAPFPGFRPFPFYRGYSADFFDGKHYVLKGGSARTAACMLRPTFRNWFQAHYPYVYAGFRCVRRSMRES